jgi:uncharacterized protein with HEPN domain
MRHMEMRAEAIRNLRESCQQVATLVTRMHPEVPKLEHAGTQGEVIRALFELTKQVEVIKKHLLKLEKDDGSTLV